MTTPPRGLSQIVATNRLRDEGPNDLNSEQRRALLAIAKEVAQEPMFLLLLCAGGIYLAMGDPHEALILLGFVVIIMLITIFQERRTENALEALRDLSCPRALAIRDGVATRIAGTEVVREDVLVLSEGDRVPADGDVLEAHELATDESMLTGESEAVAKFAEIDQVFAGTLVVRGQGLMRVTAIGRNTELGRIGKSLKDIAIESSPLREEIGLLTRRLALIGICLCLTLAVLYWALRADLLQSVLAGITLAMGILPQEFPVIMIVFLALGARRIAQQQVLTRRLNAVETLGETTVLCVDKTGTLTQNRMAIAVLSAEGAALDVGTLPQSELPEAYHALLEYAVLASEIEPHDPMEQAFHRFTQQYLANSEHIHPEWSLIQEYELTPVLPAMSHLWRTDSGVHDVVAAKGAPEAIADLCHLDEGALSRVSQEAAALADRGLRVLAVAKAKHKVSEALPGIQHDFEFEFLGLVGFADPLRPEVPGAVAECLRAGIRVVMITGDHPRTAKAIACQAGIDCSKVMTGAEIATIDPMALGQRLAETNVFARVTPQQKLAIVEALKAKGEVVAMTGDGVNDAPALKAAHIGIAMGKRGTDVAREAAALVLLEDDFTTIVSAIRLGRRIFANLRQAMVYTLAVHIPIIGLSILPVIFGMPLILAPIHIAFLELIIDPACSVVFEAEKGSPRLMELPPRSTAERLISYRQFASSLAEGALVTVIVLALYFWMLEHGSAADEARTLAFVALVTANAALIFPTRSTDNKWYQMFAGMSSVAVWVLGGTLAGLVAVTSIPVFAQAFAFSPPSSQRWLFACAVGASSLVVLGAAKAVFAWFDAHRKPI